MKNGFWFEGRRCKLEISEIGKKSISIELKKRAGSSLCAKDDEMKGKTQRQTERKTQRQTERKKERQAERKNTKTNRKTDIKTERKTDRKLKHKDRQKEKAQRRT
jgi:hypothetical protein